MLLTEKSSAKIIVNTLYLFAVMIAKRCSHNTADNKEHEVLVYSVIWVVMQQAMNGTCAPEKVSPEVVAPIFAILLRKTLDTLGSTHITLLTS